MYSKQFKDLPVLIIREIGEFLSPIDIMNYGLIDKKTYIKTIGDKNFIEMYKQIHDCWYFIIDKHVMVIDIYVKKTITYNGILYYLTVDGYLYTSTVIDNTIHVVYETISENVGIIF